MGLVSSMYNSGVSFCLVAWRGVGGIMALCERRDVLPTMAGFRLSIMIHEEHEGSGGYWPQTSKPFSRWHGDSCILKKTSSHRRSTDYWLS